MRHVPQQHGNTPRVLKIVRTIALAAFAATASIGCSSIKNGSMARVAPVTENERVGSVYLFRGFIGVFSTGIDSIGSRLNEKEGVHAEVFQDAQAGALAKAMIEKYKGHPEHEPIVLIGHSYGADDAITVARKLAEHDIKVDLIVTLDPVTPSKVPANAQLVYNLYQPSVMDNLPFLRGIPLTPDSPGPVALQNINLRADRPELIEGGVDHFNIEKKPRIHDEVIAQVMKVCQPRNQWMASRATRRDALALASPEAMPAGISIRTGDVRAKDEAGGGR